MSHVDWELVRSEYLTGGTSYRKLAEKHNVSFSTLEKRARAEGWAEQRRAVGEEAATKARQKIVSQRAKDIELLDRSRTLLIRKLCHSIEKFPETPGNRMEQSVTEFIDNDKSEEKPNRKSVKQKTVRFESDLMKMVQALDKLMEMTGYTITADADDDDGFMEALNAQGGEVTEDDADVPDGL